MIHLSPHECRALGVLVEKAQTTPQQYPLTLNALTAGCNQKNNREPVMDLSDEQVQVALDGLRQKALAREVMLTGSRVEKFRHVARETLEIDTRELVILAELLMRGPQTLGELRNRASRMQALESTEVVKNILDSLMNRTEPYVRDLPPAPGDRAPRFMQLLCPEAHPFDAAPAPTAPPSPTTVGASASNEVMQRLERLEREVEQIKQVLQTLGA
ncbi:MAG TPA: YceH family protein [Phycisphaerales bacterium]|nr:YceH family protein [Phycisphaerales bacterium]